MAAVDLAMVADERDLEDIASFVGQVEGVKNAITIRELRPGTCKLSLRTDPEVLNASRVCALLGGGATPPPPAPRWRVAWRRPSGPSCGR